MSLSFLSFLGPARSPETGYGITWSLSFLRLSGGQATRFFS